MAEEQVGLVTHYYNNIGVAVVRLDKNSLSIGDQIHFQGNETDFNQSIDSMQINHNNIEIAKEGDEFGLKVNQIVQEGDRIFKIS